MRSKSNILNQQYILQDSIRSAESIIRGGSLANSREEANKFISATNNLQSSVINASSTSKLLLLRSQELLQLAIKTLLKTFSILLHDLIISDHTTIDFLKSIADCLINSGHSKECTKLYKTARKSVVHDSLKLHKSNFIHHKLDWETVEDKIKIWLNTNKIVMASIFSSENTLCHQIFSSSPPIRDSCFSDITKDSAVSHFAFPEQIAASKCKKSPEKLFKLLDLYESIIDSSPEINRIFSSESTSAVVAQSESSLESLKGAIQATLAEFETAIKKDSSKNRVTGGGVHPLTRYVMNYLSLLADYSSTLDRILHAWNLNLIAPLPDDHFFATQTSKTAVLLSWTILVLLSKIDGKAEIYKEVSLSYLFLANNLQYIVGKVKKSEIGRILGEDWVLKKEEKVRQYAGSYERVGWSKVMAPLTVENGSVEEVKERFRKFNMAFVEVQGKQTEWVVWDQKLREEMKESLARNVVPKYREMYARYRDELASEGVVRYAPRDLENYLWGLGFGCSDRGSRTSRNSSSLSP